MRKYLVLCLLLQSVQLFSQQDNYSFFKLMVFNNEDKIMLVNWGGAWEVPGIRYNQPVSITQFIDTLAAEHGITVQNKTLGWLFTFEYTNRPTLTIMQYYTARHRSGDLQIPESCQDIAWFDIDKALEVIPYEEMRLIISKIINEPQTLWGATIMKDGGLVQFKEDFYKLR